MLCVTGLPDEPFGYLSLALSIFSFCSSRRLEKRLGDSSSHVFPSASSGINWIKSTLLNDIASTGILFVSYLGVRLGGQDMNSCNIPRCIPELRTIM